MLSKELKLKIIEAIKLQAEDFRSAKAHATFLGINPAQYSRINSGETEKVLKDAIWISLARLVEVSLTQKPKWVTVQTETFDYIYTQLEVCQKGSISSIFCDIADIGKTHTAWVYASKNKNAIHVDCSQVKSKQKLVRKIARELGVTYTGRYADVYEDLVFYINTVSGDHTQPNVLIILDEAGDLKYDAFLELKALWNATERKCGWYMMGADGLEQKIDRQKDLKKVGYTEIFSRYGSGYKKITPDGKDALKEFKMQQVAQVAKANKSTLTATKMYGKTQGSLRRVRIEITKKQA